MGKRIITVSSRALGPKRHVTCYIYDTLADMREAADRYNGQPGDNADTIGITQALVDEDGRAVSVLIRFARTHLGSQVTSHEMHHAATALYGAWCGDDRGLTHYNEPFAHLFSDLYHRLVKRLYALGYYD